MSDSQDDRRFNERLGRLEAVVEGVALELRSLAGTVSTYVGNAGKTNWNLVISATGIFLTVVTLAAGLVWSVVSQVSEKVDRTQLTTQREMALMSETADARMVRLLDDISKIEANLASRADTRWNAPDQKEYEAQVRRDFDLIKQQLQGIDRTRWTRVDQHNFATLIESRIDSLTVELARREHDVTDIRSLKDRVRLLEIEQAKRTKPVYGDDRGIATQGNAP